MAGAVTETLKPRLRKVKILATLGPASSTPSMIRKLMLSGADAFRINMSHGIPSFVEVADGNSRLQTRFNRASSEGRVEPERRLA
jgi:pyruvate kinase